MAVVKPLYWDGGGLREMTAAMIDAMIERSIYSWGAQATPSVRLTYNALGTGNLTGMPITDTRYQAGIATSRIDRFATEAETPQISLVNTNWATIDFVTTAGLTQPANTNNTAWPIYWTGNPGEFRSMNWQDMVDTFVDPATDLLTGNGAVDELKASTYLISTSTTVAGAALVDANPIFTNTFADAAAYTGSGIPETRDQPTTGSSYYLHRYQAAPAAPSYIQLPVRAYQPGAGFTEVDTFTEAEFATILYNVLHYAVVNEVGQRITYSINGTGNNRGTGMVDTRLNGTSAAGYTTSFVGIDDYRTQEFPNGTESAEATYFLVINKT